MGSYEFSVWCVISWYPSYKHIVQVIFVKVVHPYVTGMILGADELLSVTL